MNNYKLRPHSPISAELIHSLDTAVEDVKMPMKNYLKSFVNLSMNDFNKHTEVVDNITADDKEAFYDYAVTRYLTNKALIGTVDSCKQVAKKMQSIGVDEIACLLDFGLDAEKIMSSLEKVNELKSQFKYNAEQASAECL